jgi:hypothetical protein
MRLGTPLTYAGDRRAAADRVADRRTATVKEMLG